MSNNQQTQVVDRAISIVDKLASNPNSKLDADNVVGLISSLTETLLRCYQTTSDYQGSTSLTAAGSPAPVVSAPSTQSVESAPSAQTEVEDEATATETAAETAPPEAAPAPVARTAAKSTRAETVKSPAPSKSKSKAKAKSAPVAVEPAQPAAEPEPEADDDRSIAERYIREHGSAVAAAAHLEETRKRGRKTAWQKIIEERAHNEMLEAPRKAKAISAQEIADVIARGGNPIEYSLKKTGYKFAHIPRKPVMDPEKAIAATGITCVIDGQSRTMLSRYLMSEHGMTPEEYIAHFNLRADYPMTAQGYRNEKRRLAAVQELGKKNRPQTETEQQEAEQAPAATNRRSRKRAA